jgi:hypothetical protein
LPFRGSVLRVTASAIAVGPAAPGRINEEEQPVPGLPHVRTKIEKKLWEPAGGEQEGNAKMWCHRPAYSSSSTPPFTFGRTIDRLFACVVRMNRTISATTGTSAISVSNRSMAFLSIRPDR